MAHPDDERTIDLSDDLDILPDQTRDESDIGWGGYPDDDDDDARLLAERPPHW